MQNDQKETWNILADSWTNLRVKPDAEVRKLSKKTKEGPILDVGCGNCRNLVPFLKRGLSCIGLDFSKRMIREAKKFLKRRNLQNRLIIADMTSLPFKNDTFSTILCIRTLHHIESKRLRLKTLKEMKKVGDKCLVSVWKKWQRRFFWKLLKSFFSSDIYIDWNYHGKIYKRFYHLYTKSELEEDLKIGGWKIEKIRESESGNIIATAISKEQEVYVAGPIIIKNKKLLVVLEKDEHVYKFPGGMVRKNEGYVETVEREAKEEIGVSVEVGGLIKKITIRKDGKKIHLLHFRARLKGKPRKTPNIKNFRWIDYKNSNKLPLSPNIKQMIEFLHGRDEL